MNRLPRPIADWLALWRDLPRYPRQVLLNRGAIWADLDCEFCSGGPDDDGDDDPEPDAPDSDGDGLIREITDYLRATTYVASH